MPQGDFSSETQLEVEPSVCWRCGSPGTPAAPCLTGFHGSELVLKTPHPDVRGLSSHALSHSLRPLGKHVPWGERVFTAPLPSFNIFWKGSSILPAGHSPTRWVWISLVHKKLKIQRYF